MLSVEDAQIPNTSGTVRGKLLVSGWKIHQEGSDNHITFINQVDLAGSLPSAFLKKLLQQIPLCAGKVRDYIATHGFVPTTIVKERVEFRGEEFNHKAKKYTIELKGDGGSIETLCSNKMYSKGVQVQLSGDGQVEETKDEHNNPRIIVNHLKGNATLTIESK